LQENNLNDSYYVFGNNNSGKTFYAVCFANELAKRGKKICYVRVNEIEKYFKDLFDKEYGEEKKELIELMNAADYLILDDIDNSIIGFSLNEILKVIDERFENGKPIFYTSNTSLSDFERNLSRNTSFKGNPKTFINKIKKTLGVCNAEATDSILKQPYSENTKNKNVVYFNEQF
jgi:DNA replication protein DnaC